VGVVFSPWEKGTAYEEMPEEADVDAGAGWLDGARGCAGSHAMQAIWDAAVNGDVGEMERLLEQDPGMLDSRDGHTWTPLVIASSKGHVGVVRVVLDKGAAINQRDPVGSTALFYACCGGRTPVVRLLLERGADPTIARQGGPTPLVIASQNGHLEVVRLLLGHASAKTAINDRDAEGKTALWLACYRGRGGVVRALLENGADTTIANNDGITPMAIAKKTAPLPEGVTVEARRECVAALEVRHQIMSPPFIHRHPRF
jgi:hypothetical protein